MEMENNLFTFLNFKVMIAQKKSLKKIVITTGVVAMTVGLINAFSFEANATATTGKQKNFN
jgi:hypothetical protein